MALDKQNPAVKEYLDDNRLNIFFLESNNKMLTLISRIRKKLDELKCLETRDLKKEKTLEKMLILFGSRYLKNFNDFRNCLVTSASCSVDEDGDVFSATKTKLN